MPPEASGCSKLPMGPQRPHDHGIPAHTAAFAHDVFNVVCLTVLNALMITNWRLDSAVWAEARLFDGPSSWASRWSGHSQGLLLAFLFSYMVADSIFVHVLPQCVKIPGAIFLHHVACLAAMSIPWQYASTHGYTIGIFGMADLNTMFLLLRKIMMRSSKSKAPMPRAVLVAISACFYITWVVVRLILYPVWFFTVSWPEWRAAWDRTGCPVNLFVVMPCTHLMAVLLNYKWTWDLCSGLWRRRHRSQEGGAAGNGRRDDVPGDASLTEPLLGPESARVVKRHGGHPPV